MLAVLRDVVRSGGALDQLLSQGHDIGTMYRCVCRGWLKWLADAETYEITDTGRALAVN